METVSANAQTIALFGASGATGNALIRHALNRCIKIRALARNANSMAIKSGLLETIEGSLSSRDYVEFCLKDCSAAICVFGSRPPYTDIFCEAATTTIVEAMQSLADIASQTPEFLPSVLVHLRELTLTGTPAMKARGRKLCAELERLSQPQLNK